MTKINKYFIERHVHFIIKLLHITLDIFLRKNFRGLIYITLAKKALLYICLHYFPRGMIHSAFEEVHG